MNQKTVLITGGFGCIGAETAKWLVKESDARVLVCSRVADQERFGRVFYDVDQDRLVPRSVDVRDLSRLAEILREYQVSQVLHLAALQTPDCNANRDLGLQINLAGTQNLIEAMKQVDHQVERFVFASSIAVYGPRAAYSGAHVPMLAEPMPVNVYGAWKLAGENLTRLFHQETGITSLSLRPGVLFGPGRDAGLTSTPTTAMKAAALGVPYQIPFRSRQDYLFAPDVGAAFGQALMHSFDGYGAFTLPSRTVDTTEFVGAISRSAARLEISDQVQISIGDQEVPFICDLEFQPFRDSFPRSPLTELDEAVEKSISVFIDHVNRGWLTASDVE